MYRWDCQFFCHACARQAVPATEHYDFFHGAVSGRVFGQDIVEPACLVIRGKDASVYSAITVRRNDSSAKIIPLDGFTITMSGRPYNGIADPKKWPDDVLVRAAKIAAQHGASHFHGPGDGYETRLCVCCTAATETPVRFKYQRWDDSRKEIPASSFTIRGIGTSIWMCPGCRDEYFILEGMI